MRRHVFITLLEIGLGLGLSAGHAASAALPAPMSAAAADEQSLFVELIVNGRSLGTIVPMKLQGDRMLVDSVQLRSAGLSVQTQGLVDVAHLDGVHASYDVAGQALSLEASTDLLPLSHVAGEARNQIAAVADYGVMLNYDAYAQRANGVTVGSLWTEQRLFGPIGTLSNDNIVRVGGSGSRGYLRLDTRFRHVDDRHALTYTAGDLITRSLPWSTSVRIGGIQVARDFRTRPDLVTVPLPSFAGKTAVPTAVDLFVDGYHKRTADVAPGRFVLDDVPIVNGAGQATIVTTDAVGRQISTTIPFYVSSELLKPGLFDFAAEAGFLRRNYGLKSFSYHEPVASLSLRSGLTSRLTVEAHGEATSGHGLIGGGAVVSPWRIGTFHFSIAANRTGGITGVQWNAGYSYTSRRFGVAFDHEERTRNFRDLANFDIRDLDAVRRSTRVVASANLAPHGNVGLAFFSGTSLSGQTSRLLSASYSRRIGVANLFLTTDYDLRRRNGSAQLRVIVPFGRNSVTGGLSHDRYRGTVGQVDYSRSTPSEGGLGIDAGLASDTHGNAYGQGTLTWRGETMQVQAGTAFARGVRSSWGSVSGSLVMMGGNMFAARQISDSFAVVTTEGVANVPVSYENQSVGTTDKRGHLFVPNIASYQPGRFSIDALALPANVQVTTVEQNIALRQGGGAFVHMPIHRLRSATVKLVDAKGAPLQAGARIQWEGHDDIQLGWDGIAYLENIGAENRLTVFRADGSRCVSQVSAPPELPPLARIGSVPCL
jgi:outer membrane usher protein